MSVIAVTGATGQLGHLIVEGLLASGVPAADVVAFARTSEKAGDLAARGVQVRVADYDEPATLAPALAGVDVLMFVSGSEAGRRIPQHAALVDAAKAAGVARIVYTSITHADTNPMALAAEHKATEELLAASGIPYIALRNSWYIENYTSQLDDYLARGAIVGAAADGSVSAATRADYAAAAVAVLTGAGNDRVVYELGGPAFTIAELAATITEVTGVTVVSTNLSTTDYAEALESYGLPAPTAAFVASLDEGIAHGELEVSDADLVGLIGRPATPLADAVAAAKA
ncbi:SDR family oxidoreductase [Acidothermaceae bacterium B102]|nr:SDR family oxidoreductase [Acidothermaceae bacterium B102]